MKKNVYIQINVIWSINCIDDCIDIYMYFSTKIFVFQESTFHLKY